MTDLFLESYVPFLAILYIVRKEDDVFMLIRILCGCAVVITLAGAADFRLQTHVYLDLLPKSLVSELAAANPFFVDMLRPIFRNGMYRANSVFNVSLSFGEFEAIVAPLALYLLVYRNSLRDGLLSFVLVLLCPAGIFFSGSRGAYLAYELGMAVFVAGWVIHTRRLHPQHLGVAIVGLMGTMGFAFVIGLAVFWKKAHNIVFGGGKEAPGDEGRLIQWGLAWPHILANPVTGHGYATAGDVIGNFLGAGQRRHCERRQLADFNPRRNGGARVRVLLRNVGIRGLARLARCFLFDPSKGAAAAGALACSLIVICLARGSYSTQRENFATVFIMIACYHFPQSLPCCSDANDAAPGRGSCRNGSAGHAAGALGGARPD